VALKYSSSDIYEALLKKISDEVRNACNDDKLEEIIKKYDLFKDEAKYYYDELNAKILVIGEMSFSTDIFYIIAKKEFNITRDRIVMLNYQEAKHFDFQSLKGYSEYTDIVVGPNAHKAKGINGYNSIISMIKAEQDSFPLLTEAIDSTGKLKFTKTSLRNALSQTKLASLLAWSLRLWVNHNSYVIIYYWVINILGGIIMVNNLMYMLQTTTVEQLKTEID